MTMISAISHQIWDMKYRLKTADGDPVDKSIEDTWKRIAIALAKPEGPAERQAWAEKFQAVMSDFRFIPAGRIVAGAGTNRDVTLFNCFVMGTIPDDMSGIFDHLREAALTMQKGGGIGYDFSTLRPTGANVRGAGTDASGPLSFMDVWDSMCRTIMSAGYRRGAMMAALRADHPDIEAFIAAKHEPDRLRMFNLSVLITDNFMGAVREDRDWDLSFDGKIYKTVSARVLWDRIMEATYEYAEPGVIFIDRINQANNLGYCETIAATNPCGEQPLPPYGACLLGSINLARLVIDPFKSSAHLDEDALAELIPIAVRMLDNVIEVSSFPLDAQLAEAKAKRRIGLGVTGLADALIMCDVRYGSVEAIGLTERWMGLIRDHAYRSSVNLAIQKGAFPLFDAEAYLAGKIVARLPPDIQDSIRKYGIRNALLTSIAPTGTISLFADNVSSGIEPVFSYTYTRNVLMPDGTQREEDVSDYAYRQWLYLKGDTPLPDSFVSAQTISPSDHLVMQAAAQKYIDSSISKTINVPAEISFDEFRDVYQEAWDTGCKGCTTYRPNDITGSVLTLRDQPDPAQPELPLLQPAPPVLESEIESGVVYMTQPLLRPEELPGQTYKLNWPETDHAIYITINDVLKDGRRRPFEVFVNSKDTEHYASTVALTRLISAVFRRGGDVSFVVDELKAVFDPRGGQWVQGRYVPSLLAAVGDVIERHMIDIGFMPKPPATERWPSVAERKLISPEESPFPRPRQCPKCGQAALFRQEGCDTCTACDYSKCG